MAEQEKKEDPRYLTCYGSLRVTDVRLIKRVCSEAGFMPAFAFPVGMTYLLLLREDRLDALYIKRPGRHRRSASWSTRPEFFSSRLKADSTAAVLRHVVDVNRRPRKFQITD
jgi:hypothetical protein